MLRGFEAAAILCSLLYCLCLRAEASQVVGEEYKAPSLVIPYAAQKPTIDGEIADAEWQGAASLNALQSTDKRVSPRQTRFWVTWDEDNLYIAMRSPLRDGERLIQTYRTTIHLY